MRVNEGECVFGLGLSRQANAVWLHGFVGAGEEITQERLHHVAIYMSTEERLRHVNIRLRHSMRGDLPSISSAWLKTQRTSAPAAHTCHHEEGAIAMVMPKSTYAVFRWEMVESGRHLQSRLVYRWAHRPAAQAAAARCVVCSLSCVMQSGFKHFAA